MVSSAALVMPLKSFGAGKGRLSSVLDAAARQRLSRECAERVVAAAAGIPVVVVTDAAEATDMRDWAATLSVECIIQATPGLNGAVGDGVAWARNCGFDTAVVAHSDVPLAIDVRPFIDVHGIVVVPDTAHDGTNLMSLPCTAEFTFHYGPGSFRLHVEEAMRCGYAPRVALSDEWSLDLDNPDDLNDPRVREVFPWLPTSQASPY
ncbi:MAG: 2-phospho-L-lactate guanylyltransferase [Actinomycetota bacterium]